MCSKREARRARSRLDRAVEGVMGLCSDGSCAAFEQLRAVGNIAGGTLRSLYDEALGEPLPDALTELLGQLGESGQ